MTFIKANRILPRQTHTQIHPGINISHFYAQIISTRSSSSLSKTLQKCFKTQLKQYMENILDLKAALSYALSYHILQPFTSEIHKRWCMIISHF